MKKQNKAREEDFNDSLSNSKNKPFFVLNGVGKSWRDTIEIRFDTLLKQKGMKWSECYNSLSIDKADASRIKRGLVIPPLWQRIKIASFFEVDTSVIWNPDEIKKIDEPESLKNVIDSLTEKRLKNICKEIVQNSKRLYEHLRI